MKVLKVFHFHTSKIYVFILYIFFFVFNFWFLFLETYSLRFPRFPAFPPYSLFPPVSVSLSLLCRLDDAEKMLSVQFLTSMADEPITSIVSWRGYHFAVSLFIFFLFIFFFPRFLTVFIFFALFCLLFLNIKIF